MASFRNASPRRIILPGGLVVEPGDPVTLPAEMAKVPGVAARITAGELVKVPAKRAPRAPSKAKSKG